MHVQTLLINKSLSNPVNSYENLSYLEYLNNFTSKKNIFLAVLLLLQQHSFHFRNIKYSSHFYSSVATFTPTFPFQRYSIIFTVQIVSIYFCLLSKNGQSLKDFFRVRCPIVPGRGSLVAFIQKFGRLEVLNNQIESLPTIRGQFFVSIFDINFLYCNILSCCGFFIIIINFFSTC